MSSSNVPPGSQDVLSLFMLHDIKSVISARFHHDDDVLAYLILKHPGSMSATASGQCAITCLLHQPHICMPLQQRGNKP